MSSYRGCWVCKFQNLRQMKQDIHSDCWRLHGIKSLRHYSFLPCFDLVLRNLAELGDNHPRTWSRKRYRWQVSPGNPIIFICTPCQGLLGSNCSVFLLLIGWNTSRHGNICCWALDQPVLFKLKKQRVHVSAPWSANLRHHQTNRAACIIKGSYRWQMHPRECFFFFSFLIPRRKPVPQGCQKFKREITSRASVWYF